MGIKYILINQVTKIAQLLYDIKNNRILILINENTVIKLKNKDMLT